MSKLLDTSGVVHFWNKTDQDFASLLWDNTIPKDFDHKVKHINANFI